MSKVSCLKEIIKKLTDDDIDDPSLDTICKCLGKLAEVISSASDGTKWFVVNDDLMSGGNAPSGAKPGDLVLDNQGDVFEVDGDLLLASTDVNLKGTA